MLPAVGTCCDTCLGIKLLGRTADEIEWVAMLDHGVGSREGIPVGGTTYLSLKLRDWRNPRKFQRGLI